MRHYEAVTARLMQLAKKAQMEPLTELPRSELRTMSTDAIREHLRDLGKLEPLRQAVLARKQAQRGKGEVYATD